MKTSPLVSLASVSPLDQIDGPPRLGTLTSGGLQDFSD
jgi:hypothetical protein